MTIVYYNESAGTARYLSVGWDLVLLGVIRVLSELEDPADAIGLHTRCMTSTTILGIVDSMGMHLPAFFENFGKQCCLNILLNRLNLSRL
jgi:hypothetical protein